MRTTGSLSHPRMALANLLWKLRRNSTSTPINSPDRITATAADLVAAVAAAVVVDSAVAVADSAAAAVADLVVVADLEFDEIAFSQPVERKKSPQSSVGLLRGSLKVFDTVLKEFQSCAVSFQFQPRPMWMLRGKEESLGMRHETEHSAARIA